ncbi:hypothetical protein GRI58_04605 [Porphyrobacter algicida]|uniref:Uncharacterized protein n=1 Tax=Qipengyuania algicida TaxID=1836209 RepID=A0A845ACC6_9SPHN|nr:hypothetical protein [Qipengyuania algicida]MXP28102.1 hypothetical protein [Qipengyuania algicida]
MSARASFKQADVSRALKAAQAAGLTPSGYRIDPATGAIEVQLGGTVNSASNSFDRLMGPR